MQYLARLDPKLAILLFNCETYVAGNTLTRFVSFFAVSTSAGSIRSSEGATGFGAAGAGC